MVDHHTHDGSRDLQPHPGDDAPASSLDLGVEPHVARLRRLHDYLTTSVAKLDPLEASIGGINCGLMQITLNFEELIVKALAAESLTLDRLETVAPAIDTYLRLVRQVDRFAQLELRAAGDARPPRGTQHGIDHAILGLLGR